MIYFIIYTYYNYLVFAAVCAELKLLLFNSMSGFLFFSFVDCCSPLLSVYYEIYIIFPVAGIYLTHSLRNPWNLLLARHLANSYILYG